MYMRPFTLYSKIFNTCRKFHSQNGGVRDEQRRAKSIIDSISTTESVEKEKNWRTNVHLPEWKRQKLALKEKFKGEQWSPKKKLSREQMESMRLLKKQFPNISASELGNQMKVSPEVVRRILKSKWQPSDNEMEDVQRRWKKRGLKMKELYETGDLDNMLTQSRKIVLGSNSTGSDFVVSRVKQYKKNTSSKRATSQTMEARRNLKLLLEK